MKPKLFGEAVTSEEITRAPAESGPTALVRLCGALIATALGDRVGTFTLPEISERIDVPDGGIDAQYAAPASLRIPETGGLVGPGRTVFQFKYRDAGRQPRSRLVKELIRSVPGDLARAAPVCDRYVLMTNLDLGLADRRRLHGAITGRLADATTVVVWGASELALQVNQVPHLRNLLVTGGLCTLDVAAEELEHAYRALGWPSFRGRGQEVAAVQAFLADPEARLLEVAGPRYVGKTRLVIEALRARGGLVAWSGSPAAVTLELFRDLDAEDRDIVLVVDRCERTSAARLAEHAGERRRLKTILLIAGGSTGFGVGRARVLEVPPLGEDDARRLVGEVAPGLSFGHVSWIGEVAGGLPGLLLHAAALVRSGGVTTREPPGGVRARLAQLAADALLRDVDRSLRPALAAVALLPLLGVGAEAARELDAVGQALGLSGEMIRQQLPALREAGVVRDRGRFVEVVPPLLGEHLVSEQLATPRRLLADLEISLPSGFLRLLERVRDLDHPAVRSTVAELLSPDGWFPDLPAVVRNAGRLRVLAPAAPAEAVQCLQRILPKASVEQLAAQVTSDARRAIVDTLEDLALRVETFEGAAGLLLALAEAENETWANNATGVFTELFFWAHPQVPAPLARRAAVLSHETRSPSPARRELVARACGEVFGPRVIDLRPGTGPAVPEPADRPTREDVSAYSLAVLEVLGTLSSDPQGTVREAARAATVRVFRPCVHWGLLQAGLHDVARRAFDAVERIGRGAECANARARVVTELELLEGDLTKARGASPPPQGSGREAALARTGRLIPELTDATLRDRLWQWAGRGSLRAELTWSSAPEKARAPVDSLANQLLAESAALREHLPWLTGEEAVHRHHLFHRLGEIDEEGRAWAAIVAEPTGSHWAEAFAAYCVGRASTDAAGVEGELDRPVADPRRLRGIVLATARLLPGRAPLDRLVRIAGGKGLRRSEVAREVALEAPWREMPLADAERLLCALDDGTADLREILLQPLLVCLHAHPAPGRTTVRALAWSVLETAGPVSQRHGSHAWDGLAAWLGQDEPGRLGILLQRVAHDTVSRGDSLSLGRDLPLSWGRLKARDRGSALQLVLRVGMLPHAWPIADELPGLVDPVKDREDLVRWVREAGPESARFLGRRLDPECPGFWELVPDLLLAQPDEETAEILVDRLHTGAWSGSAIPMIDGRLAEARKLGHHPEAAVRVWASRAVTALEAWRRSEAREDQEPWIWDYRVQRADLEAALRKADSPERRWAIGRLLEDAPERRVLELLTADEILEALPSLSHLDRMTRAKWETWARHRVESGRHA